MRFNTIQHYLTLLHGGLCISMHHPAAKAKQNALGGLCIFSAFSTQSIGCILLMPHIEEHTLEKQERHFYNCNYKNCIKSKNVTIDPGPPGETLDFTVTSLSSSHGLKLSNVQAQ